MPRLACLLVLLSAALPARAQVVTGVLVDSASGMPVNGAIVALLDSLSTQHGGAFTDAQGRFELRAPSSGAWRVRAERVGYRSTTTPLFSLSAGGSRALRVPLARSTARLSAIRVTASRRCVIHPERGAETAELWSAVRTALRGTALTSQQRQLGLRIASFSRELDPGGAERWASRRERTTYSESPFVSVPIDDLERDGFVVKSGENFDYRVPDAPVLLSERFLETHCFRLEAAPRALVDSLVGLAFEPVPGRTRTEVQGVLWVSRETAELRSLDVRFVGLELPVIEEHAGSRIEFRQLPTGHWVIGSWVIRMPIVRERRVTDLNGLPVRTDTVLHAVREMGGEVVEVLGERRRSRSPARITGSVFDSTRGIPLAGARVFISGTSLAADSDSAGWFAIDGVPAGDHAVAFVHPRLDTIATVASAVGVGVAGADTAQVDLGTPTWRTILRATCGDTLATGDGAVVGWVRSSGHGLSVADAIVTVQWTDPRVPGGSSRTQRGRVDTRTDRAGAFRACGIRGGASVRVMIGADGHAPIDVRVPVRAGELTRIDHVLPREPGRVYEPPGRP